MIRLFINSYTDKNAVRQREYDFCYTQNKLNPFIDSIVDIEPGSRPSFADMFRHVNDIVSDEDISLISNLDIYFDHTLDLVNGIKANECYALSRHDETEKGIELWNHKDSQDVWMFRGKIKEIQDADEFGLGVPGCDNRLCHILREAGYAVTNPSKSIHAIHVHASDVRGYRDNPEIQLICPQPPYAFVEPCKL